MAEGSVYVGLTKISQLSRRCLWIVTTDVAMRYLFWGTILAVSGQLQASNDVDSGDLNLVSGHLEAT